MKSTGDIFYSKHRKGTLEVKPRQTDRLNDPRFGLQNLLECIFHEARNIHLTKVAEEILLYIKNNRELDAGGWEEFLRIHPEITYSSYQSALQKLRSIGILCREHCLAAVGFKTFLMILKGSKTPDIKRSPLSISFGEASSIFTRFLNVSRKT